MGVTVSLLNDEIRFLEETAQKVLKENFPDGWWLNQLGFAELDISKATPEQIKVLLRRLGGYNPRIIEDTIMIPIMRILDGDKIMIPIILDGE